MSALPGHFGGTKILRPFAVTLICLGLLGCSFIPRFDSDDAGKPRAALHRDNSCVVVAAQRAQDAAYSGYDRDMQTRINQAAYTGCLAGRKNNRR
jgi:hypothetical protein